MFSTVVPLDMSILNMSTLEDEGVVTHGDSLLRSVWVIYTDDVDDVVIIEEDDEAGWEFVACTASVPSEPPAPSEPQPLCSPGSLMPLAHSCIGLCKTICQMHEYVIITVSLL